MSHMDDMAARLPQLYRDGERLRGVLEQPAVQLEIIDELARTIAQSRWFDAAQDREDVVKLARLLDIQAETWQDIEELRAWVHSLRNAWLRRTGSVTVAGLQEFVKEYTDRYQRATGMLAVPPVTVWSDRPDMTVPSFIENPGLKRMVEAGPAAVRPLHLFTVSNKGLDPVPLHLLIRTLSGGEEYLPLIANVTTGHAVIYKGVVGWGQRLWINAMADGTATATLENTDVSDRLVSVADFTPGSPFEAGSIQSPANALVLNKGNNTLWFFPCALFDEQGLDRYLSSLAALNVTQGEFDGSSFDQSLFSQDALAHIDLAYEELQPASFSIELPAGSMLHGTGGLDVALDNRETLASSLQEGVDKLKAVGVQGKVTLMALKEVQHQRDCLKDHTPKRFTSIGPTGTDREPLPGALYEKTGMNKSIFQ